LRRFKADQRQPAQKQQDVFAAEETLFADDIGSNVLKAIKDVSKKDLVVQADDNLELDHGLDSLSKIELVVALEAALALKLPEDFMSDIHTIRELVEKIRRFSSGSTTAGTGKSGWKEIIAAEPAEQIVLERPELMMLPSRIVYAVLKLLMKLFFRLEARGLENISGLGNFIITPNHTSYMDGFVVVLSLPFSIVRNLYSLGISDFFAGPLKSWFAKRAHVIPIDSSTGLSDICVRLRHGRSTVWGGRSPDNTLLGSKRRRNPW
jgi:long-chain acyl-CoA synthetase